MMVFRPIYMCYPSRPLAIVYYMLAASTGTEVANFNLAYLCDENIVSWL